MHMKENTKNITVNRKARHDYHIISSLEAGIVLVGTEVKSCRQNKVSLVDCYATIEKGEVFKIFWVP